MDEYRIVLASQTVYKLTFSNISSSGIGISDGNKGDVTVSGNGTIWEVDHYVKEVIEVANFAALPVTGQLKNLYKTLNDGLYFEWNSTTYVPFTGVPPFYLVPGINVPNGVFGLDSLGRAAGIVTVRKGDATFFSTLVLADGEMGIEVDGSGNIVTIRFGDGVTTGGKVILSVSASKFTEGQQTIAALSASVNNWSPTSAPEGKWRISSTVAVDITGIASPARTLLSELWNIGTFNITLKHFSASSGGVNRFRLPNNIDLVLLPNMGVQIWYDSTQLCWRVR